MTMTQLLRHVSLATTRPQRRPYLGRMPNGKAGDHPLTDIVVHRAEVFGDRIDTLIGELDARGLWASPIACAWLYERYWDYRETQQHGGEMDVRRVLEQLESRLLEEVQRLRGEQSTSD